MVLLGCRHLRNRRRICCRCFPLSLIFAASTLGIMWYTPLNHDFQPPQREVEGRNKVLANAVRAPSSPNDEPMRSNESEEGAVHSAKPWICLHPSLVPSIILTKANCSRVYIGTSMGGRLGNLMFIYAATLGISYLRKATPVTVNTNEILVYFQASMETVRLDKITSDWREMDEKHAMVYDGRVETLSAGDLHLTGYFQSWKYFNHPDIMKLIAEEFQFKFHVLRRAQDFTQRTLNMMSASNGGSQEGIRLVGVHIRRGDFIDGTQRGLNAAPIGYIENAIRYFLDKYSAKVAFVVSTDSKKWVNDNIMINGSSGTIRHMLEAHNSRIFMSDARNYSTDLAILTLCGDVIITVGTFGWWAGWLSTGDTVYYKGYPHPQSEIYTEFKSEDYYPSSWIGLT